MENNKKSKSMHSLSLPVFHGFHRDNHFPVLLLSREHLGAHLKLETLLGQRLLEQLADYPAHAKGQSTDGSKAK
jgi:hypothetical protein